MKKVLTRCDLAVVSCLLALREDLGGVTITRYVGGDRNAPEYKTAHLRIPGIRDHVGVKIRQQENGDWVAIWISVPGGNKPGEFGAMYDVRSTPTGLAVAKRQ